MPAPYTGVAANGARTPAIEISRPSDGDAANAASVNGALGELADYAAHFQAHSAYIDDANTFTAENDFQRPVEFTEQSASNHDARLRGMDVDGNQRWMLDHNGMPSARISEVREEWIGVHTALGDTDRSDDGRWLVSADTAGTATPNAPTANLPARTMLLASDVNDNDEVRLYSLSFWYPTNGGLLVLTWEAAISGTVDDLEVGMGVAADPANVNVGALDRNAALFYSTAPGAGGAMGNWFGATCDGGASTSTDTGVAPSATYQRFRIEIRGTNLNGGERVKFYINEVHVATGLANLPGGAALSLLFYVKRTDADTQALSIGPVLAQWTRFEDVPEL